MASTSASLRRSGSRVASSLAWTRYHGRHGPRVSAGRQLVTALPAPRPSPSRSRDDAGAAPDTPPRTDRRRLERGAGHSRFGIDSNFFNIGGHSLMATRIVSRVGDLLELEIPLRLMFEHATVRGFAEAVTKLSASGDARAMTPVIPVQANELATLDPERLSDAEVDAMLDELLTAGETLEPISTVALAGIGNRPGSPWSFRCVGISGLRDALWSAGRYRDDGGARLRRRLSSDRP